MNALTKTEADVVALVESPPTESLPPDSLLNFVAMAVRDPSVDVTKLEALLRMQREIVADDGRVQFNRAYSAAQAEMLPVTRDAKNDQTNSKYARLETIDAAIRPIYTAHGFAMSFDSEPLDTANVRIVCEVMHRDGHSKTFRLEGGLDMAGIKGNANKTPMHALGSSVSYLRRYLKCLIWDIALANEDNDGNRPSPRAANDDGRMSAAELKLLDDLMIQTGTGEGRFLAYHKLDYRSIQQVPASEFIRLKNALLLKVSMLAQRAALQTQNKDARS
jgi:hypothetical protein